MGEDSSRFGFRLMKIGLLPLHHEKIRPEVPAKLVNPS